MDQRFTSNFYIGGTRLDIYLPNDLKQLKMPRFGVKRILFALGKCWKKGRWMVSIYQRIGDPYVTMKVKKLSLTVKLR